MMMTAKEYRKLFLMRTKGELDDMECTKSLFRLLRPLSFPGMSILDVPCGTGHYYRKLRELEGIRYTGIDLDAKAVKMAIEYWKGQDFHAMDATDMKFSDNTFDAVVCYNLVLHLNDYRKIIRELFRVSKRYILIRSLFSEDRISKRFKATDDYLDVYKGGFIYYNTHSRDEVSEFVRGLGKCRMRFIPDNITIPKENIERQVKATGSDAKHFTVSSNGNQRWKGLDLNYEVLLIEKVKI